MKLNSLHTPKKKEISNFDSAFSHRNRIIDKIHNDLLDEDNAIQKKEITKAIRLVLILFTTVVILGYLL